MATKMIRATAVVASMALAACNFITGAEQVELADDDDGFGGASSADGSTGSGVTNGNTVGQGGFDGVGGAGVGPAGVGGANGATTGAGPGSTGTTGGVTTTGATSGSGSTGSGGMMCGGAGPMTTPLDSQEQAFLGIINNYRAQNNLGPLTACVSLNRAAQGHSEDMRDNNYFSHTGLDNSSPWDRACDACFMKGCGPSTAMAENIAAGNSGAQATFDQWKNSPGHNANMLNGSFNYIGIGRATGGGQYGVYWTNKFAGADEPSCY